MSDRDTIFKSIREALAGLEDKTGYPDWDAEVTVSRHAREEEETLELFKKRLEAAKGVLIDGWESLREFLESENVARGYIDPSLAEESSSALEGMQLEEVVDRERIDDYAFGITRASGGIAESGTIILRDSDSPYRLGSLAPWIHVAVLRREAVVRTVAEAVAGFGSDPSIIFATGPSKTADIEGILIQGVHGPGIQAVCLV